MRTLFFYTVFSPSVYLPPGLDTTGVELGVGGASSDIGGPGGPG